MRVALTFFVAVALVAACDDRRRVTPRDATTAPRDAATADLGSVDFGAGPLDFGAPDLGRDLGQDAGPECVTSTDCLSGEMCSGGMCVPSTAQLCSETCTYSNDGDCDDGGPGSDFSLCDYGTDCLDCGPRSPM